MNIWGTFIGRPFHFHLGAALSTALRADSFSRKYFEYYAKNKEDTTTLRILKKFNSEIFSRVRLDIENDDIIFIQSDNGQLDTKSVKAYIQRQGVIQRFTLPYHHNMSGFIERASESMNDMARTL